MKRLRWAVLWVTATVLLAGCGEIQNTLSPRPDSANTVTVALDAPPNFSQIGLFEAQAEGLFAQTDLSVRFIDPTDPLAAIESGEAQVAISNEPAVLLARNRHHALAAVAAILQGPQHVLISCREPARTRTASASRAHPPLRPVPCRTRTAARPDARYVSAPTYNGLNLVVTETEIISHAAVLRRFVQAVSRGYVAARADPEGATSALVRAHPGLSYALQLAGVRASLANFFPTPTSTGGPGHPWGWESVNRWNLFGTWLYDHHQITDVNAIAAADTNELLAGQGV